MKNTYIFKQYIEQLELGKPSKKMESLINTKGHFGISLGTPRNTLDTLTFIKKNIIFSDIVTRVFDPHPP